MNREINIRLNANRAKAIHTGHKFASGDKGIVFRIAVDELNTEGTTAKIVFKRSNGTSVEAEITEETEGEGVYSYTTLGNEFAVVGPVTADVKFYDENENRVSTCTFLFDVTADTLDGLGVGTASYSDTLERMKKSMEQAEADMLAAKAELEKQAEEILQQMEKTAENAEGDIEETEKKMADLSADLEALYQEYMAAFGNVGPFNPRGPYSETETYTVRDMVSHNDASWVCYRNCTGATPGEGSDCWQKLSVEAEVNPEDFLKKTDVDIELNEESKNPIANMAVAEAMKNVTVTTDTELSKESENAIANKAVAEALENVDAKTLDGHKAEYFARKTDIIGENILINPDFKINQRGLNSYTYDSDKSETARIYTVDRWNVRNHKAGFTITSNDGGLSVTMQRGNSIHQFVENFADYAGKTVTLSAKVKNVTGKFSIAIIDGVKNAYLNIDSDSEGVFTVPFTLSDAPTSLLVYVNCGGEAGKDFSLDIEWMKLEVGTIATDFVPPNPATELLKCQRYYQRGFDRKGTYVANYTEHLTTLIPLKCKMRTTPTIKQISGTTLEKTVYECNNGFFTVDSYEAESSVLCEDVRLGFKGTFNVGKAYEIRKDIFEADAEFY